MADMNQMDELERCKASEIQEADPASVVRLDLPARHKFLNVVGACLTALLERIEPGPEDQATAYNLELAVHEACTNIVDHAYEGRDGRLDVTFSLAEQPRRLVVDLHDSGRTFDLSRIEDIDLQDPRERGYGLFLVQQLLDEVCYYPETGNNHWRLVKRL
jgi:serine/threonine-protein kinase RsbW